MSHHPSIIPEQASTFDQVVDRNIRGLLERRRAEERGRKRQERIAAAITGFIGTMRFVYLHALFIALWILVNVGVLPGPRFDPSLVILAMVASVEALFLTTFVLITQNRMQQVADKRADLDLHTSLLAEHEITRLVVLVREIARQMGIGQAEEPEVSEATKDVRPEQILDRMEEHERNLDSEQRGA